MQALVVKYNYTVSYTVFTQQKGNKKIMKKKQNGNIDDSLLTETKKGLKLK